MSRLRSGRLPSGGYGIIPGLDPLKGAAKGATKAGEEIVEEVAERGAKAAADEIPSAAKVAVTYGDNATSKLRSHWGDIQRLATEHGVQMPGKFKEAGPQVQNFIEDVVRLGETRVGPYKPTGGGWSNALWTKHGNTIVIRSPEGKFVTILDAAGGGAAKNYPGGL